MKQKTFLTIVLLTLIICTSRAFATEYWSWGGGNWTTTSTWAYWNGSSWVTATSLPAAADGVQLMNSSDTNPITLASGNTANIDYMYMGSGGDGDKDQLEIYGTLDINNTGGAGYNTLYFGNWGGGYDADSEINVYSGATFDPGNIYVVNSHSSAVHKFNIYGGTVAYISSVTLNNSLLYLKLYGGDTYISATSISGASSSKLTIKFMNTSGLLVIDSTLLTNLINAGCISANGTTVNSSNRSTLLDEDATYSPWIYVTMAGGVPGAATTPSPANSATGVSLTADLSWTAGSGATSHNVYFGTDSTPDSGEYIGNQTGTTYDPGTLTAGTTYYWRIDEVNSNGTTTGTVWSFTTGSAPSSATSPSPANSATLISTSADLSWTAGSGATSHNVYFGTTSPGTYQGNQTGTTFDPGTLSNSTTYYWRIDEVNAFGTTTGTVWNFTTAAPSAPDAATNPSPANSATSVSTTADLSWTAGNGATSHNVYFGTSSPGAFQGNQAATTFDTGTMSNNTTYFWRIDEVNAYGTTTGTVWSFTTAAAMASPVAKWAMDDNAGTSTVTDSSGNSRNGTYYSGDNPIGTSQSHVADRREGTGALLFDSVNDQIVISGYKGMTGTASRSCMAWIKTSSLGEGGILDWGSTTSGSQWRFILYHGQIAVVVGTGYRLTTATVNDGQWHHVAAVLANDGSPNASEIKLYIDGVEQTNCTGTAYAVNTGNAQDVVIGLDCSKSTYLKGYLDDIRIYDSALSSVDIAQVCNASAAKFEMPYDASTDVAVNRDLSWTAGNGATSHNVYFGTSNPPSLVSSQQTGTTYDTGTMTAGATYYWRIDEVSGSGTTTGAVWSFTTENYGAVPGAASEPSPPAGEINVWKDIDLHWTAGSNTSSYNVYFGTDSTPDSGEFKGNQFDTVYTLSTLSDNTTYYWRIDSVNNYGTTTGTVWSFTTETGSRLDAEDFAIFPWDYPGWGYQRYKFDTMRACGFNLGGFVSAKYFDRVSEAGLKAFAHAWDCMADGDVVWLSQSEIDSRVSALVNSVYGDPAVYGYMVRDEPSTSEFDGIDNWVDSFHAADPDAHVYVSLGYPYDWTNYLANVSPDYLSYDFYGMMADGSVNYYYYYYLEQARNASVSSGKPFWNIVESMKEVFPDNPQWNTAQPSPATLRLQAFTSMAYGAKGVGWFIYFSNDSSTYTPIVSGSKTNTWTYLKDVNMAIHGMGSAYIELVNSEVFHHPNVPYGGRSKAYSSYINNITGGDFCVGEYWKAGESGIGYLMVVNKSLTSTANFAITYKWASTEYWMNPSTGQWETLESNEKYLAPGEGMLIKFVVN